jgi:hypothetical protein
MSHRGVIGLLEELLRLEESMVENAEIKDENDYTETEEECSDHLCVCDCRAGLVAELLWRGESQEKRHRCRVYCVSVFGTNDVVWARGYYEELLKERFGKRGIVLFVCKNAVETHGFVEHVHVIIVFDTPRQLDRSVFECYRKEGVIGVEVTHHTIHGLLYASKQTRHRTLRLNKRKGVLS